MAGIATRRSLNAGFGVVLRLSVLLLFSLLLSGGLVVADNATGTDVKIDAEANSGIGDPNNTLSPELPAAHKSYIDDLQTSNHQQDERHKHIYTKLMDNDRFNSLLLQWHYLNKNFAGDHIFQTVDSKEHRILYIKDLLMRIMGAVHSVLEPTYGALLRYFPNPGHTSLLSISLTPEQTEKLVDLLVEMDTLIGNRLYSYESFVVTAPNSETKIKERSIRRIYQIPVLWAGILHSLDGYGVLTNNHTRRLGPVVNKMVLAHGQAFHGITVFKSARRELPNTVLIAKQYYDERIQAVWKTDFHPPGSGESFLTNPNSAANMDALEASCALLSCQQFIVKHGIQGLTEAQLTYEPNQHTATISEGASTQIDRAWQLAAP